MKKKSRNSDIGKAKKVRQEETETETDKQNLGEKICRDKTDKTCNDSHTLHSDEPFSSSNEQGGSENIGQNFNTSKSPKEVFRDKDKSTKHSDTSQTFIEVY